jgi:Calcineurin-like phosphoesterase
MVFKQPINLTFGMFSQVPTLRRICLLFCGLLSFVILGAILTSYAFADFNFPAVGDWGCNGNTQKTVNNVNSKGPERVLALGDYSYQNTATCWLNLVDDFDSRMRIAIGNHEDDDSEGYQTYKSHFGLGNPYYSFNYNNVHVLVMDTDRTSFSSGSSQYNFVKNDLQSAKANSNIKWIIVYLHKPMYTSPNSCSSSGCTNGGSTATSLRNTYHAMFDQNNVDVVLQGHVHDAQRTYPIKYSGGSTPTKTSSATTDYNDPQGEVFAVVGTGGINFHALSGKPSWVKFQQDDDFGILDIKITNNGYKLEGRYWTNSGSQLDKFTITKTGPASYSFGPSLTLSGESAQPTGANNGQINGQNNVNNNNDNNDNDNGKHLGLTKGQGKGLNCEHFTQQGPLRCRDD